MVALRAHDRRHRGLGAGHGALARLRGGRRDIPFGPRRPAHEQAPGGMGVRQRREAVGGADRQLPRQRGRRVLLRDAQERDVFPLVVAHQGAGALRRGRLHRGLLQPGAPALDDRVPDARGEDGRVLRADRPEAGGGAARRMIPADSVSEILKQINVLGLKEPPLRTTQTVMGMRRVQRISARAS